MVRGKWEWNLVVVGLPPTCPCVHSGLAPRQSILGKGHSVRALSLLEDTWGGLVMA